jgi:hypothetical protein
VTPRLELIPELHLPPILVQLGCWRNRLRHRIWIQPLVSLYRPLQIAYDVSDRQSSFAIAFLFVKSILYVPSIYHSLSPIPFTLQLKWKVRLASVVIGGPADSTQGWWGFHLVFAVFLIFSNQSFSESHLTRAPIEVAMSWAQPMATCVKT